ncbi:hypothetical protein VE01_09914 [Pseudogymnoascus verrucosus]|uniref:Isopenicillin N synthase-like Fe(2+) 2OG dioxygenase domain-containing protein n=1 Tax=Pseudogymnoascus verrucosus TaxID=342668 RepID=A0A1B8G7Z9_9PEZI|nr:uncharacterized protein VE01_09914 [Pseudogymnoascus verrucosus]OBT91959.1 hypothetical protein VE01_09914 [Pseudogymnoascus verrucosus]
MVGSGPPILDFSALTSWGRGYSPYGVQMLEPGTKPEMNEGFFLGDDIPTTHPYFVNKKMQSGPNVWPKASTMAGASDFKVTSTEYLSAIRELASDLLKALALTLGLSEDYFNAFKTGAVPLLKYLHYPPQEKDSEDRLARGIGAHTDWGAITLLLQGEVDGLQVWDNVTEA